jgi:2-polyprenyl-6-hydroxyphenyl methylase/3-demethylubiquinone-9 3-methyltransferase
LEGWLTDRGLSLRDSSGVVYHPVAGEWRKARDMDVNYMLVAQRPA